MKIGILGSGGVARDLAVGFVKHGYEAMISSRTPAKAGEGSEVPVGSFKEAARFGDVVVLAAKGTAAADVLRAAGAENLAGKVVIDVTNPIADAPPVNGVLKFFTTLDDSLMERLQREFPAARFVKAFNQVHSGHMVNPDYDGVRPTMFICGNDEVARKTVAKILDTFGWEVEDMGGVEAARAIEPLCMLWVIRYIRRQDAGHAFKLLR